VKRKILLTGCSKGIGYHLVLSLIAEGYFVYGISRSKTEIKNKFFSHIKLDLNNKKEIKHAADYIKSLDIFGLINNAGAHGPIGPFVDTDINSWENIFDLNLFSAARLVHICSESLIRNSGAIIFLSGGGAAYPRPNFSGYSVSKTAIVRLSEVLSIELAPEVLVYCIAPGPNKTDLLQEAIDAGNAGLVDRIDESKIVDFDMPIRLCNFLMKNKNSNLSGKFIHVKDNYEAWKNEELQSDTYTLRRIE
jgi:NAD(P)-dependent dehydrogenase (short-subunit alcohol dehydrogenase family)|tara:strand:- start:1318 stop:2064 length:747 start_codon:yes stop_codon:yes gene_type:complete